MQTREDKLNNGRMLFRMHADRNPSSVILHRDDAGLVHRNRNLRPEPREHFVARVVDDFLNDVKRIVRQRVHARTLLDGFKALQHPDGALAVIVFVLLLDGHCCVECAQNALRRKTLRAEGTLEFLWNEWPCSRIKARKMSYRKQSRRPHFSNARPSGSLRRRHADFGAAAISRCIFRGEAREMMLARTL